jgi:hypothetical protein
VGAAVTDTRFKSSREPWTQEELDAIKHRGHVRWLELEHRRLLAENERLRVALKRIARPRLAWYGYAETIARDALAQSLEHIKEQSTSFTQVKEDK